MQVSIFGDGSAVEIIPDHSVLSNYEKLADIGTEAAVPVDIKSSFNRLNDKIAT